ncbi:MAG: hypothetical protein ABI036_08245 [Fibrobacteria bacterium]
MFSAILFAALTAAASPREGKSDSAKADSLVHLGVLISSEIKGGNQVYLLENKGMDSLVRGSDSRDAFIVRISDSSLTRRIRNEAEFRSYWKKAEAEAGFPELRSQLAAHDLDKSRIPKRYLFDSSVVIYPGCIVLRRMRR